ncbi:MAG: CRISPR-associated ring nuclease [Anaerolineae bacterium]|nr:CRISPR-associated ring nuclease [Thermoflexales bacterium]MDW8408765.1 CRISPR-associated ring nuclease [Anaerolineae bacterium]
MSHILVATLSTEPQGVTRVLDALLRRGYAIREVAVIHTTGEAIRPAIERLDAEFQSGVYPGIRYRRIPLVRPTGPVTDIRSEADAGALLQALYRTLRAARQAGQTIHLSITSGRKTMAVYAMVAAQLLFREEDRAWHMLSVDRRSDDEKQMHLEPGEHIELVAVPVLRWSDASAAVILEATDDPWEAIQHQRQFAQADAARRRREFLERYLTPAERRVCELLVREGLDNAALARRLHLSEQTIANHLSKIYRKFGEWRGSSGGSRAALIAEFSSYLAAQNPPRTT